MAYDIDQYLEDIEGYPEVSGLDDVGPMCPKCGGESEDKTGEYFQCVEEECGIKFDEVDEEEDE